MISAWGIEHGEVSKSFRKLAPKLASVNQGLQRATPVSRNQDMGGRLKENYSQWRHSAGQTGGSKMGRMMGKPGVSTITSARHAKEGARAMVTASGKRSKRKGRVLP
jgi:hypothetical protein